MFAKQDISLQSRHFAAISVFFQTRPTFPGRYPDHIDQKTHFTEVPNKMQENRQTQGFQGQSGQSGQSGSGTAFSGTHDKGDGGMLGGVLDEVSSGMSSPEERTEGTVARAIESQTSKLPSDTFLWAAVGAMGVSAACELAGAKSKSRFFGQWVAPLLLFGVYNKLVKVHGHDEVHH